MKKYGEPSKLKMAGAASLQRENNNSELGMSKKYPREDPTEWLTGSLAQKEPRKSKLDQYNQEADLEYKGLTKVPSSKKLESMEGHNQSQGHIPSIL